MPITDQQVAAFEQKMAVMEGLLAGLQNTINQNALSKLDTQLAMMWAAINRLGAGPVPMPQDVAAKPPKFENGGTTYMPDGNCQHTSSGQRKTLEFQPGTGDHRGELQMANVDEIGLSLNGNFPCIDTDGSGNGTLAWVQLRSDDEPEDVAAGSGTADEGTSDKLSRSDHVHHLDLSDATPADVVTGTNPAAPGVSDGISRDDHVHHVSISGADVGLPNGDHDGDILYWNGTSWQLIHVPAGPAVLAYDSTSKTHWVVVDAQYKVVQRDGSNAIVGDWVRAHG